MDIAGDNTQAEPQQQNRNAPRTWVMSEVRQPTHPHARADVLGSGSDNMADM